jgi:hypothetical protein
MGTGSTAPRHAQQGAALLKAAGAVLLKAAQWQQWQQWAQWQQWLALLKAAAGRRRRL